MDLAVAELLLAFYLNNSLTDARWLVDLQTTSSYGPDRCCSSPLESWSQAWNASILVTVPPLRTMIANGAHAVLSRT